ncbi:MAG: methyltransferase domain-containing protein, partial [Desulfobacterales bacterium]
MLDNSSNETREYVRKQYVNLANGLFRKLKESKFSPCCTDSYTIQGHLSKMMGYSKADLDSAPNAANMGLGCGNPKLIAALKPGETVLDLGSGAGFDCFLAAKEVGPSGKVIGVDMTPEMVSKARKNAATAQATNV